MTRSHAAGLALGLWATTILATALTTSRPALAQMPPECAAFTKLRDDAGKKAEVVRVATGRKGGVDRKEVCAAITNFATAEAAMVKFLEANKTWCGVPDQAVVQAKASHERTMKFKVAACTEGPANKPKAPSLSDAINAGPSLDTSANTKTGRGTFDTLTGNPLAH